MTIEYFFDIVDLSIRDILNDKKEYLKLLKVIGNNKKYDFLSQLSIYSKLPYATACLSYDMWKDKFSRIVMKGEKGIPVLDDELKKVIYVFDITQTVSLDDRSKIKFWNFDKYKHKEFVKAILYNQGYKTGDILEDLYSLSKIFADEIIYELIDELIIKREDREKFANFIRNSITFSISNRFNIPCSFSILENGMEYVNDNTFIEIGNCISSACNKIIEILILLTSASYDEDEDLFVYSYSDLETISMPSRCVESFMFDTLKTPEQIKWNISVRFSCDSKKWSIEGKNKDRGNRLSEDMYGTSRVNAYKLMEDILNSKDTKIFDQLTTKNGTKILVINKKESTLAHQKQELLKEELKEYYKTIN